MSKNLLTATQPQCNRNFCQFNKDQYCIGTILRFNVRIDGVFFTVHVLRYLVEELREGPALRMRKISFTCTYA